MPSELPLIDCRPWAEFVQGHAHGACSLPARELFARLHELPKRLYPIALCGHTEDLQQAQQFLGERGYTVAHNIEWTPAYQQQLQISGQLESGEHSRQLWQPAPLLQRFVEELMPEYGITPGKGLDIACGAGRDLVYLASQGWQMTGVDWSEDSLRRVSSLAGTNQVSVETHLLDLETEADPFPFADAGFELICVARYLHRPLFPAIKRLLKPGGIIIYQTFMQGCENTAIGRPRNPKFLLAHGELAGIFHEADILLDEVEMLEDGRPVSAFVARC